MTSVSRTYADRCPGVFRPWLADDGAIVRLRTPGGRLSATALRGLLSIAEAFGDGTVLLTSRANVQLRGIPATKGRVPSEVVRALQATGLLPSRSHELVRNIVASPLTGRLGGRLDMRPVVEDLDRLLRADPDLAGLGGRFLFVLDDGRGDVACRALDLGVVAVSDHDVQVRAGSTVWGPVVPATRAAHALTGLARAFQRVRGSGDTACWHVDELPVTLTDECPRDPRTLVTGQPVGPGRHTQDDGRRLEVVAVPDGLVTRGVAERLLGYGAMELVVTPWRSVVMPDLEA